MKHKTVMIGLGTISLDHKKGVESSPFLAISAVCDLNPDAKGVKEYSEYAFYTSYIEMLEAEKPEYAVILTPPSTHFAIASECLRRGVNVICEKPAMMNYQELETVLSLAEEKNLAFTTCFHWQFGSEIALFGKNYDPDGIEEIETFMFDSYSSDGENINPDKISLGGVIVDSVVNILSLFSLWTDIGKAKILSVEGVDAKNVGLPLAVKVTLECEGKTMSANVEWRNGVNRKITVMRYGGSEMIVNHTAQSVEYRGNVLADDSMERLTRHYYNFYSQYCGGSNAEETRKIHKLLFEILRKYEDEKIST